MFTAVGFQGVEVVKILQQRGGRLDYRRENGDTALIMAVQAGDLEMAKHILASPEIEDKKAYVNIVGDGLLTALFVACSSHNTNANCLEWLIEQGADMKYTANDVSVLHYSAKNSPSGAQITALLGAGFPIDTCLGNLAGHTALHSCAASKCLTTAATLMNAGLSPHAKNSRGETPGFYVYHYRQLMFCLSFYPFKSSVSIALAMYPQVNERIVSFGQQFQSLAESMTTSSNPMR